MVSVVDRDNRLYCDEMTTAELFAKLDDVKREITEDVCQQLADALPPITKRLTKLESQVSRIGLALFIAIIVWLANWWISPHIRHPMPETVAAREAQSIARIQQVVRDAVLELQTRNADLAKELDGIAD